MDRPGRPDGVAGGSRRRLNQAGCAGGDRSTGRAGDNLTRPARTGTSSTARHSGCISLSRPTPTRARRAMIPTVDTDSSYGLPGPADPGLFCDGNGFQPGSDDLGDWWLDLGYVPLPGVAGL